MNTPVHSPPDGFSLVELLVVIAIIGLLATLLLGAVNRAMVQGRNAWCSTNMKQLFTASQLFAQDHGFYAPAASDIMGRNLKRWHGERASPRDPFDGKRGPLATYLEGNGDIRHCPLLAKLRKDDGKGFESACGGYGYNQVGIGSTSYASGFNRESAERGIDPDRLDHPLSTILFAETAFPQPYDKPDSLIEYSFAEPYFHLQWNATTEASSPSRPSIHFRHLGRASVVWADGHGTRVPMRRSDDASRPFRVGWPGGANNALFKPFDL